MGERLRVLGSRHDAGPEIGRLVAEQIADGAITSIDVSALRLERFADDTSGGRVKSVF